MKKMFMAVIALMMTISASAQFYIYCSDGNVIKVDSISMVAPTQGDDTPSAGIGTFSVSATKQVTFSPGNLQYTQSTDTWSFAENQYDYLGEANIAIDADVLADKVDLFGWSTSTTNFGVSTSTSSNDYSGSFVDWGTNKIGTDAPNTWRTLTRNEWEYVVFNRPSASSLNGVAQVNGVNGLILLPDNWTCPAGVTFKSSFHSSYGVEYYAAYQTFTADQWSKLEAAGAVILSASGRRNGSNVLGVLVYGEYWSASEYNSYDAYFLYVSSGGANMNDNDRDNGRSVRLVKDIVTNDTTNTPTDPYNGHEYVDLGLSVKWATCNVGANAPEEYGDYFAWGETTTKSAYDWSTYKWCNGSENTMTKYCTNSSYGIVDNKTTLELSDDAARANWGGSWRMPTDAEMTELREQCIWTWTTRNGVNGYIVTAANGNSIFLPAAGLRFDNSLDYVGKTGCYWSSLLYTDEPFGAYYLAIVSTFTSGEYSYRSYGFTVRPVCQQLNTV